MIKKMFLVAAVLIFPLFYYACGGGGSDTRTSDNGAARSTVPLYLTDDIGDYKQVLMTLNSVSLNHKGTGASCDLLTEPEGVDIANLEGVMQFLNATECSVSSYNRVDIEIEQSVDLMDSNGNTSQCTLDSYFTNGNNAQPNVLVCEGGKCGVSLNGNIASIANTVHPLVLDFDLKNFLVNNFGLPDCSGTFNVEPLNDNDIEDKIAAGYKKSLTGYVSSLDIDNDSFTLTTRKGGVFTIDYSQVLYEGNPQTGLDEALQFAEDLGLRVRIITEKIDVSGSTEIEAKTIYIKVEGMIRGLDDLNSTFTLENAAKSIAIDVDYTNAVTNNKVEGNLLNDLWVETKLFGFDGDIYFAHEVEVEDEDAVDTDD